MQGTCDVCGWEGKVHEYRRSGFRPDYHSPEQQTKHLCEICESTQAGSLADLYGPNHSCYEGADLKRMLAYCTNLLLAELRKGR